MTLEISAKWEKAQRWEKNWWDNCVNTYGEETKQLIYAEKMGLTRVSSPKTAYLFDLEGKSVLDIGGGPCSLLLKCINKPPFHEGSGNLGACVIDPMPMPQWVLDRYKVAGIFFKQMKGENINAESAGKLDEIWIYNCLEHAEDPKKIIENAQKIGKIIRLFEWIDTVPNEGHPHCFTENQLNEWLKGEGKVEMFNRGRARGKGYFGVFLC